MNFFIPLKKIPSVTKQMKRVTCRGGKPIFFDSPAAADARALFCSHLAKYAPPAPIVGAIQLFVTFIFPTTNPTRDGKPHTNKPDTDNLIGIFKDCLTDCHFWKDDCQVADEHVVKIWQMNHTGIYTQIKEIEIGTTTISNKGS